MPSYKRVTACSLLLAMGISLSTCVAQSAGDGELTDLIKRIEPSVVRIDVFSSQGEGIGSGFVVGAEGIVVTNHHVMAGSHHAEISFNDKKKVLVLGTLLLDKDRDIAVVKIEAGSYPKLKLAGKLPSKGTRVVAFGAPQGFSFSATEGIVSAVRSVEELKHSQKKAGTWIQTSTPISPGNSGGPLVNRAGEVVGANTLVYVQGQNLNFAISSVDIASAVEKAKGQPLLRLIEGAAKEEADVSITSLAGAQRDEAIAKLADLILAVDSDSPAVEEAAMMLLLIDPNEVDDVLLKKKVAKAFKRLAFDSHFHQEEGIRGMARWGGKESVPYFAELLTLETFHGSEAIYEALSESDDPRASEAIASRLSNFFDHERALAALTRMGPAAEPGLIRTVSSPDPDVSLISVKLLAKFGTEASLSILNEASRKGIPAVRVAAKSAMFKIRARKRKSERSSE